MLRDYGLQVIQVPGIAADAKELAYPRAGNHFKNASY